MTAFHPLVPFKAIEMIEAADIPHAPRLIRDRAAAGLVKSYALLIKTIEIASSIVWVCGSTIPKYLWDRSCEDGDNDIWTGGIHRLSASDLIGGAPAVEITGMGARRATYRVWLTSTAG